ncbi:hypothetical protein GCM10022240_21090 [Microbacterium kribbense]|uniref:Restriction endonuclease type II-like domain-containing protein n=1 Tax=Microbacterium kribbense TaxID=433645 RepID=A0ABP7GM35_9MICO
MRIEDELDKLKYIHRADLTDRGWSEDAIRRSVRREKLLVIRRAWIVSPAASSMVILAARTGVRLTCRSAADALGIWRPDHDTAGHLALSPHAKAGAKGTVSHWSTGVIAPDKRSLVDPLENVLAAAARCLPFEDALAMWESALNAGKATIEHLLKVTWRGPQAHRLLECACADADSGLETRFVSRMRRIGIQVRQQVRLSGHPVDGLIGERLVIQLDGYTYHSSSSQRRTDIAHDRALRLLGYTVLRFDYVEIMHDWAKVEAHVTAAMAQGLHRA